MNARKVVSEVIEGFKITSSTQEVEISATPWQEVIAMQKMMLKANPRLAFDVIDMGAQKFLLIYKAAATAPSNVYHVDFKNKTLISRG